MRRLSTFLVPILALILPIAAAAQESGGDGTMILAFYALVGFFGAASVVVFIGGFIVYLVRLGTERREAGIKIMEWGFSILVVVVLCIGILRWLQG